jgi:hypothetical protein
MVIYSLCEYNKYGIYLVMQPFTKPTETFQHYFYSIQFLGFEPGILDTGGTCDTNSVLMRLWDFLFKHNNL